MSPPTNRSAHQVRLARRDFLACVATAGLASSSVPAYGTPAGPGRDQGADTTEIHHFEDVVYGRVHGAGLLADIAYPESDEPLPAIISVHGGRWRVGDKQDRTTISVEQWARFGYFAMSIDYRLVPCSPVPACYQDVQCAIRYVHAHADRYGVDRSRVFLMGQSAGGHLVALAATLGDGDYERTGGWEEASNDLRAAICVSAPYELTEDGWNLIWTPVGVDAIAARKVASPVNHVSGDSKPLLILHSIDDRSVPISSAVGMVEQLKKAGVRHRFLRYPDLGHMEMIDEVIERSREFLDAESANTETK